MIPFCTVCYHNRVVAHGMHLCVGCANLKLIFAQAMTVENSFSFIMVKTSSPPAGAKVQITWAEYVKSHG